VENEDQLIRILQTAISPVVLIQRGIDGPIDDEPIFSDHRASAQNEFGTNDAYKRDYDEERKLLMRAILAKNPADWARIIYFDRSICPEMAATFFGYDLLHHLLCFRTLFVVRFRLKRSDFRLELARF